MKCVGQVVGCAIVEKLSRQNRPYHLQVCTVEFGLFFRQMQRGLRKGYYVCRFHLQYGLLPYMSDGGCTRYDDKVGTCYKPNNTENPVDLHRRTSLRGLHCKGFDGDVMTHSVDGEDFGRCFQEYAIGCHVPAGWPREGFSVEIVRRTQPTVYSHIHAGGLCWPTSVTSCDVSCSSCLFLQLTADTAVDGVKDFAAWTA